MLPDRVSNPGPLTYASDALDTVMYNKNYPTEFFSVLFHFGLYTS